VTRWFAHRFYNVSAPKAGCIPHGSKKLAANQFRVLEGVDFRLIM